jgi:hypothetical protein
MGLDNYAKRSPEEDLTAEDEQAFQAAGISLCDGPSGFRGKLYADIVERVTGISLYTGWLAPEIIRKMYIALERCDPVKAVRGSAYQHDPEVVLELRKFFRVCVERNLGITSSW